MDRSGCWPQDLAALLGDAALPELLAGWGSTPLLAPSRGRHDPASLQDFFSTPGLSSLLANMPQKVARSHVGFARDGFEFDDGRPSPDNPFATYLAGGTVFVNHLHHHWPPIAALTCWLTAAVECAGQTNAYLTPPQSQGFTPHTDAQDVLILQLEGHKTWRVFPAPFAAPFEKHKIRDAAGPPTSHLRWASVEKITGQPRDSLLASATVYRLAPGDVLCESQVFDCRVRPSRFVASRGLSGDGADVPRGVPHDATTTGETAGSLHLTMGLGTSMHARYWILRNMLSQFCKQRGGEGILCAGKVGAALVALKDDPAAGGWLRSEPQLGWMHNDTAAIFGQIWRHLRDHGAASPSDVQSLQTQVQGEVDQASVVRREHSEFAASEMASTCGTKASPAERLGWRPPAKTPGGKLTLHTCLSFRKDASFKLKDGHLRLRVGRGRKKSKEVVISIANPELVAPVVELMQARLKVQSGLLVAAMPVDDTFTKLALAQQLLAHGVVTLGPVADSDSFCQNGREEL